MWHTIAACTNSLSHDLYNTQLNNGGFRMWWERTCVTASLLQPFTRRERVCTCMISRGEGVKSMCVISSLLLADFLVDHWPEVGEDLVFTFSSLLSVEHGQSSPEGDTRVKLTVEFWGGYCNLPIISVVDLVLFSDTHSLHTTMPEREGG